MKAKSILLSMALAGAMVISAETAQAASKVFDTFGSKYTSNPNGYYCIFGANDGSCGTQWASAVAFKFSPGVSGPLAYVDLAFFNIAGTQGATVTIVQDNGGSPKPTTPVLETMYVPKLTTCFPCSATKKQKIASKLHPALTAGASYWLVVYPSAYDAGNFVQHSPSRTGPVAFSQDAGTTWNVFPNANMAAFDVFIQ